MKTPAVVKTEIIQLNIPFKKPEAISLGMIYNAENIVIKVYTDTGLIGTGEASPLVYIVGETQASDFELAKNLAALLKGKNPLEIEARLQEFDGFLQGNYTIKSAFDMALYDILAKQAGMPLYWLLGGAVDRKIQTDMTVYLSTPEKMAAEALEYKKEGFPAIKVKLGTTTKEDVARIRAIRKEIGRAHV